MGQCAICTDVFANMIYCISYYFTAKKILFNFIKIPITEKGALKIKASQNTLFKKFKYFQIFLE